MTVGALCACGQPASRYRPPDVTSRTDPAADTPDGHAPRRILVVDDEPVIRTALSRFFRRRGWHVDEAADGEVARECLLGGSDPVPYDAVISDMRMPRLSGARLHDELQRERPQLLERCSFSTGDGGSPDAAAFIERTRCPVIAKPFELAALEVLVTSMPPRQRDD